jgi:transcriptional regulator with XRE-family HTH domain
MNDARFGRLVRARRIRARLRQADVGARASVSQSAVSAVECGRLDGVTVRAVRRICRVVGMDVELDPRVPAGEAARLLDAAHAAVVEYAARRLAEAGWEVVVEYTFNVYGERGSVDVVGWHPKTRTLAILEVKTRIVDIQDMLAAHDRKVRLVPRLVANERGWHPAAVARILAVPRTTANRTAIARHVATIRSAYPDATFAARSWIPRPTRTAAVWMVPASVGSEPWQVRRKH